MIEENGLLYEYQVRIGQYTIDFFLPELDVIIEADGVFGHLNKRDRKRDADLGDMGYPLVWHLKEQTLSVRHLQELSIKLWAIRHELVGPNSSTLLR